MTDIPTRKRWRRSEIGFVAIIVTALVSGAALLWWPRGAGLGRADPKDSSQTAQGRVVYNLRCASCHGENLQGQPNWQERKPDGKLPAPPHDANGHTWHHPDDQLFGFVKNGIVPYAPAGYKSDMPAFGGVLIDEEIWAVLAYIKSKWPADIQERQEQINRQANQ